MRFFSRSAAVLRVRHVFRLAKRHRFPRPARSGYPLRSYKRVTRKLAFLVDPVSMTLLPWAWPKHFGR